MISGFGGDRGGKEGGRRWAEIISRRTTDVNTLMPRMLWDHHGKRGRKRSDKTDSVVLERRDGQYFRAAVQSSSSSSSEAKLKDNHISIPAFDSKGRRERAGQIIFKPSRKARSDAIDADVVVLEFPSQAKRDGARVSQVFPKA